MLADHIQLKNNHDKRTTMKNQNRSATLERPAMKLCVCVCGGGGGGGVN